MRGAQHDVVLQHRQLRQLLLQPQDADLLKPQLVGVAVAAVGDVHVELILRSSSTWENQHFHCKLCIMDIIMDVLYMLYLYAMYYVCNIIYSIWYIIYNT